MSLTRRFLNLARANLNALLDQVAEQDSGILDNLSDEELEAELLRRQARRERELELRRMREEAQQAARSRAARSATSGARPRAKRQAPADAGPRRPRSSARVDPRKLATYYARLEVPEGADLAQVKASYRRLMRKYHPDRYAGDPKKAALATELTQQLSQAYREIRNARGAGG